MRPRRMKMHNVVAIAREQRPQHESRCHIDRIANPKSAADDACAAGMPDQRSVGIAEELHLMTGAEQFHSQSQHLRFTAAEPSLGIDCGDSQLSGLSR